MELLLFYTPLLLLSCLLYETKSLKICEIIDLSWSDTKRNWVVPESFYMMPLTFFLETWMLLWDFERFFSIFLLAEYPSISLWSSIIEERIFSFLLFLSFSWNSKSWMVWLWTLYWALTAEVSSLRREADMNLEILDLGLVFEVIDPYLLGAKALISWPNPSFLSSLASASIDSWSPKIIDMAGFLRSWMIIFKNSLLELSSLFKVWIFSATI